MSLPVVDLSLFTKGNDKDREQIASELVDGFSQHGFAKIIGHGIREAEVANVFEWVRLKAIRVPLKTPTDLNIAPGSRTERSSSCVWKTKPPSLIPGALSPNEDGALWEPRTAPSCTEKACSSLR